MNPVLWGRLHAVSLVAATRRRGVYTCVCVHMCVSVLCQLLGHTGKTSDQRPQVPCLSLDFSSDQCVTSGKVPLLFGPQVPHL